MRRGRGEERLATDTSRFMIYEMAVVGAPPGFFLFLTFFNHILKNEPGQNFFRSDYFESRQSDGRDS
jgi:hypothetical protein